ncbi:LamG domain-containing protein [Phragmitibacter flavus]|uniref:LamG domain-containing protein n=1 Tax=Phragmitibacter flavus TaxID=2576071 RepID=A0A5R8K7A1_9BACT|nr:LamG domain-containing protein [Phragmitibacter flavus]TLD68247.1 LamG domain-containing protein [Phragmitibacter flavus]
MNPLHLLPAALITLVLLSSTQAATVAHWRFEGDTTTWLQDSSSNAHHLSNTNSTSTQLLLPATGDGSSFANPIPQSGLPNLSATSFTGSGSGIMATAGSSSWTSNTFTIEAMVNISNTTGLKTIVGHLSQTLGRSWLLGIQNNQLSILLGDGASATETYHTPSSPNFTLALDKDYYVAVAVNLNAVNASERLTFYIQNLTDDGPLISTLFTSLFTSLEGSTDGLAIGSTGHASSRFTGLIDEVRFSNTTLSASQLLVPEPSRALLLSLGAALFITNRRRNLSP